MTTVGIEQAKDTLPFLIAEVARGEHVFITENHVPVAELVSVHGEPPTPVFGSAKGMIEVSEDFEAPLDDFR